MIAKKVSDKEVSEPKQEKTTETKKENKKQQTNLPKVKKIDQSGDPYENKVTVSDLDSIYILVNKYSGLPEDYEPSDYEYMYDEDRLWELSYDVIASSKEEAMKKLLNGDHSKQREIIDEDRVRILRIFGNPENYNST